MIMMMMVVVGDSGADSNEMSIHRNQTNNRKGPLTDNCELGIGKLAVSDV